jgi:hypothetical protein
MITTFVQCLSMRRTFSYVFIAAGVAAVLFPFLLAIGRTRPANLDTLFNMYVLEQVFKNITDGNPLYYGQIFFPHQDVLAYSSNLITYQIFFLPLRLMGCNPQIAFNATFILCFVPLAIIVFEWALALTERYDMSAIIALSAVALSVPVYYLSFHFQLFGAYGYLLALFLVERYYRRFSFATLAGILVVVLAMVASDPSVAMMGIFIIMVYLAVRFRETVAAVRRDITDSKKIVLLAPMIVVFLVLVILIMLPYLRVAREFGFFTSADAMFYRTRLISIFNAPPSALFHKTLVMKWGYNEAMHFAGFIFLGFTLIGGCAGLFFPEQKQYRTYAITGIIIYLVSAGPLTVTNVLHIGPWKHLSLNPFYDIPYLVLPGFRAIRSPGRYGFLLFPMASFFAVHGIVLVTRGIVPPTLRMIAAVIFAATLLVDGYSIFPLSDYDYESSTGRYAELNAYIRKGEAIVKLPYESWPSQPSRLTEEMVGILRTGARDVNGYSGHTTAERDAYQQLVGASPFNNSFLMNTFLSRCIKDGVTWIAVESDRYDRAQLTALSTIFQGLPTFQTLHFMLFRLR